MNQYTCVCACVSFIFKRDLKEEEFHCTWREISSDNSRKELIDYVAEDLTEEKKAIAGWNHCSGEEKGKPLNSGSSVVDR